MKQKILLIFILSAFLLNGVAQSISAYAASDKSSSHLAYYIAWICSGESSKIAKDNLIKQGYDNKSISSIGYKSIEKGFFTLIKTELKNSDGTKKVAYRFGVDATSMELSLKDALSSMPWSWTPKDGYEIVEQKAFSSCDFNSLTCTLEMQNNGTCGNVIKSCKVIAERIKTKTQMHPSQNKKYFTVPENHTELAIVELIYKCETDNKLYSNLEYLGAETTEKLEELIAKRSENSNPGKNLIDIEIVYKSSHSKDQTQDKSVMALFFDEIKAYIKKWDKEWCDKNPMECEKSKTENTKRRRRAFVGGGIKG